MDPRHFHTGFDALVSRFNALRFGIDAFNAYNRWRRDRLGRYIDVEKCIQKLSQYRSKNIEN